MAAWGRTPDSYLLPSIELEVDGAGWLSGAAVGSWSLDRELVASTIPGNIRQRTGLSIGAASVTVRPSQRSTPWSKSPATRVETGLAATLYAEDPSNPGGERLPLGAWVTDETDGALSAEESPVELLEASYAGRDVPPLLPAYANAPFTPEMPVDPVWPIARLLEQVGFPASPRPVQPASTLLAVPMDGAVHATMQAAGSPYTVVGEVAEGWSAMGVRGLIGGGVGTGITAIANTTLPISRRLRQDEAVIFTFEAEGAVWLLDVAQGWLVRVVVNGLGSATVAVHNGLGTPTSPQSFPTGEVAPWPDRVQVEIRRSWDAVNGRWSALQARARSGVVGWSDWSVHNSPHVPVGGIELEVLQVVAGTAIPDTAVTDAPGRWTALAVTTDAYDPGLWAEAKAILQPLGGDVGLPWTPAGIDAWEAVQDAASAYGAAVIVDLDGMAHILTPADLAGATDTWEPVDVGAEFDDLPWTVDPDDTADRVAVTYTPPAITSAVIGSTALAPVAWRADDVIEIAPGVTITIPAVLDGRAAVGIFSRFIVPEGDPSAWWSQSSNVIAFDNPEGTGEPIAGSLVAASVVQTSPTTATITVANRTSSTAYLVDGNGEPGLILRARLVATYDTPQVVERGAAADKAERPIEVDLAPWVQSKDQAQVIADRLWGRVSGGGLWKAATVRCRLDWSLDIGQVRPLVHEGSDLGVQALITKVHYDGSPGQIAQSLDLVLVPWTYADFATAWATEAPGSTHADFAETWAGSTHADFATDPLRTGA